MQYEEVYEKQRTTNLAPVDVVVERCLELSFDQDLRVVASMKLFVGGALGAILRERHVPATVRDFFSKFGKTRIR
jgi:hypothetical protein